MRIPKSKMPTLINLLDILLSYDWLTDGEREMLAQMHDKASLCQHGDGTALDIEVYYGFK